MYSINSAVPMHLSQFFSAKAYCKMVFKSEKNLDATKFYGNPYYCGLAMQN